MRLQRSVLVTVALLIFALACEAPEVVPSGTDETRPNVLFVFYDQLRADVLGAYDGGGNITTPHLDRMAQEGVLFTNGISTTPVCTPYRGMVMTGRYPTHSGVMLNFLETNPNLHGIARVFRDAGYRTAFIGKWHLAAGGFKKAWVGEPEGGWDHARPYMEENPHYDFVPLRSSSTMMRPIPTSWRTWPRIPPMRIPSETWRRN